MNKEIKKILNEKCFNTITKGQVVKCPDQLVAKISFNSKARKFKFTNKMRTINDAQGMERINFEESENKEVNAIIILLESPHTDEYKDGVPVGPANGKTGENINKYLTDILNEAVTSKVITLYSKAKKYDLILMNAIQYQCSLGVNPILFRDFCFMKLWEREKTINSLNRRLNIILDNYRKGHIILINGCTLGSHSDLLTVHKGKITKKYLKEIEYEGKILNNPSLKAYVAQEVGMTLKGTAIKQHYISHPSSWYSANNRKLTNNL